MSTIEQQIGARLRIVRQLAGLSLAEVGDGLGVTRQQVYKYETGRDRIPAGTLVRFAEICRQPVAVLFADLHPDLAVIASGRDDAFRTITRAWQHLDAKTRRALATLVTALADRNPQP